MKDFKSIETIYRAGNKTSGLYFESKKDAELYASQCGIASGVTVFPVAIVPSSEKEG